MDTANLMNVYCYFESLACIILRCLHHLNFRSNQTPKNLADSTGTTSTPESCTIYLGRVCTRMKCISSFFSRANAIPLVTTHLSHTTYTYSRHSQFVVTSLLYMIRLMSSMNPTIMIPSSSSSLYNKAIYRMNRIRNNGDPYDIPIWSSWKATSISSNQKHIVYISR